jgi:hypothetical protein
MGISWYGETARQRIAQLLGQLKPRP